jgi:phosphonate transport system substrate-binding protein
MFDARSRRRPSAILVVAAVWAAMLARAEPVRAAAPAASAPADGERPLKLGTAGRMKADPRFRLSAAPLAAYLSAELKRPVRLVMYPGYNDIVVPLASGDLDLAILPPLVHLHAHETLATRALAYGIYPTGRFTYRAHVLARLDDAAVRQPSDLKGLKVAFVDPLSASGYVYPKLALASRGLGAKEVEDVFCGSHLDALRALDAGQVAAAAVYELLFERADAAARKLSDYRVLVTTDPIPSEAVVAASRLDPATAASIQDLLLRFYARARTSAAYRSGRYIGFIPPDPSVLARLRADHARAVSESGRRP